MSDWEYQHPGDIGYWHGYLEGLESQATEGSDVDLTNERPTWALLHNDAVRFWEGLMEGSPREANK